MALCSSACGDISSCFWRLWQKGTLGLCSKHANIYTFCWDRREIHVPFQWRQRKCMLHHVTYNVSNNIWHKGEISRWYDTTEFRSLFTWQHEDILDLQIKLIMDSVLHIIICDLTRLLVLVDLPAFSLHLVLRSVMEKGQWMYVVHTPFFYFLLMCFGTKTLNCHASYS